MLLAIHKRLQDREEGFTLIELLIVVIIIGILAAIAIPTFLNQRDRAYRSAVQSDLRNLAVEAETYYTDNLSYDGFTIASATSYRPSDGVTATVEVANATTYCIEATHTSFNETEDWSIEPGNELTTPSACP